MSHAELACSLVVVSVVLGNPEAHIGKMTLDQFRVAQDVAMRSWQVVRSPPSLHLRIAQNIADHHQNQPTQKKPNV